MPDQKSNSDKLESDNQNNKSVSPIVWLEENAIIIVLAIAGFVYLIDYLDTIYFLIVSIVVLVLYVVYIFYEKKKSLQQHEVIIE